MVSFFSEISLRLQEDSYKNLDTCYSGIDEDNGNFHVDIEWNSCVDFNEPLRADLLKADSRFSGAHFDHRGSGSSFKEEYVSLLKEFWSKHVDKLAAYGKSACLESADSTSSNGNLEFEPIENSEPSGAGIGNSEANRKTEQAAIETVTARYKQQGWHVESVEQAKCGYDLRCVKGNKQENVEVKGISG